MHVIDIPAQVNMVIDRLNANGYEAYIVGGCVRDYLLGTHPKDFDITTSALPCEIVKLFFDYALIETGIIHGTLTVIVDHYHIEVTTYRIDGDYDDHRHPSSVLFTDNLELDLARRDFTMNAIAYHPKQGLVDPFHGHQDISNGIIRAVNDASNRFEEDALRIMRAIRFMSTLGFEVEPNTLQAMKYHAGLLLFVSSERLFVELSKMLMGRYVMNLKHVYSVLHVIIPELGTGQEQQFITHTLSVISSCNDTLPVRLSALLYATCDYATVLNILSRLKCDNRTKKHVLLLVDNLDTNIDANRRAIKLCLNVLGTNVYYDLIDLKMAILANDEHYDINKIDELKQAKIMCEEIILNDECYSVKQLAVNGNDLLAIGLYGKQIGLVLNDMLHLVVSESHDNNKEILLKWLVNEQRNN